MSARSSESPQRKTNNAAAAAGAVFQIPATMVEPQFPDVEEELKKWRLGDAKRDSKARALARRESCANLRDALSASNYTGGATGATGYRADAIRLSAAQDQARLNRFIALHAPVSLHEKQLTNFEVRRLMQRTKGKPAYAQAATGDDQDDHDEQQQNKPDDVEQQVQQQQARSSSKPLRVSRKPAVLREMNEQCITRKGAELNQIIREAARDRAAQMPLPPKRDRTAAASSSPSAYDAALAKAGDEAGKAAIGKELRQWYHSLGLSPPKK
jgi:hypothetical protein